MHSIFLFPHDNITRESIRQYIVRHPVSLQKITYESTKGKIIYHTKYNIYCKENIKLFTAVDFIAELTQHIPPKRKHLIRYYGLYANARREKKRSQEAVIIWLKA